MRTMWSIFIVIFALPFAIAGLSMAPWVPTKKRDVERFLNIIDMKPGERFLEIGCGDARIAVAVANKYPENDIQGIELAPPIFVMALFRKIIFGGKNIKLRLANAFGENFASYEHIYVFGMPDKLQTKIVPKFLSEAKVGAKLYSYVFSIPEIYRENAISIGGSDEAKIHILEKK